MSEPGTHRLAIDIGGTFTDVVLLDAATQELTVVKVSSTPADRAVGFFQGIERVLAAGGARAERVAGIAHGSTVLNISRKVPAPATRLATTYSFESSDITEARVRRVNCGR